MVRAVRKALSRLTSLQRTALQNLQKNFSRMADPLRYNPVTFAKNPIALQQPIDGVGGPMSSEAERFLGKILSWTRGPRPSIQVFESVAVVLVEHGRIPGASESPRSNPVNISLRRLPDWATLLAPDRIAVDPPHLGPRGTGPFHFPSPRGAVSRRLPATSP